MVPCKTHFSWTQINVFWRTRKTPIIRVRFVDNDKLRFMRLLFLPPRHPEEKGFLQRRILNERP